MRKNPPSTLRSGDLGRCVTLLLLVLISTDAAAYLDPSTGSMVVSAIVGIFASIALAVKTYWYKLKGWFRRGDSADDDRADKPSTDN